MTTSETTTEETLQLYTNPLLIQNKQLTLFEEHVFGGAVVLDGNNVFTFGLEMGATMTANIVSEMTNSFQSLYPSRAQTMSDLYRHMSDYDYIDMFSTPATTSIELMLDRNYLINNAPTDEYDSAYNKIVIPEFSTFTIGDHTFGMHYPIEIRIRKAYKSDGVTVDHANCLFQCVWDTTTTNPLYQLTSNVLEHRTYQREGLTMFCISIPIHQFSIATYTDDSISSTGFVKRYPYSNKFYAIRVFHYSGGHWVEMCETLSDVIYDPNIPTAKISVMSDIHMIDVSIPQVYFTNNLIGNKIMCLLYTTEGEIDVDISTYNTDQFSASFLIDDKVVDDTYSAFLKRVPLLQVLPLSTRISSGTNGKTFNEMKNRVINSVGGDDLLVTTAQLKAHLSDVGFNVTKYIDNITNRIYLASKTITDSNSDIISSGEFMTTITDYMLANADEEYNTIKTVVTPSGVNSYGEYMIMPNTIFKYDDTTDSMIPLSRYETKALLTTASTTEMIKLLNSDNYTFTPFHIKLSATKELPMAGAYDLLQPTVSNVTFVEENTGTNTQVSMLGQYIEHLDNGTGGYRLLVALYKTDDLSSVNVYDTVATDENIIVILRTLNYEQSPVYIKGTYYGQNSSGKDLISFDLSTDYKILATNVIDIKSFTPIDDYSTSTVSTNIPLENEYEVLFFAKSSLINSEDATYINNTKNNIPTEVQNLDMIWLATQSMDIKLGESISSLLSNTFVTIEGEEYNTYSTTTYATYISATYERYVEGDTAVNGTTVFVGDLKLTDDNLPIVEHEAGDVILVSSDLSVGEKGPCCSLKQTSDESGELLLVKSELIYLDSQNMTSTANVSNVWMPYHLYQGIDGLWHTVYTGDTTTTVGVTTATEGSIIEVQDLLKLMIDNVHKTELKYTSDLSLTYTSTTDSSGTTTYTLGEQLATRFVFVKDDSENTELPQYQITTGDTDKLELLTGDDNNRGTEWGALYMKDLDKASFDYKVYLTESELGEFYAKYDVLLEQYPFTVTTTTAYAELLASFNIDTSKATSLLEYRCPWTKIIEATDFETISKYWGDRELLNFTKELELIGETATYTGVLALNYIQTCSINMNYVQQYTSQADAIAAADLSNAVFRLIWTPVYDKSTDSTLVQDTPLVGDLEIGTGSTTGALLWGAHTASGGSHYLVATGPSLTKCYNELMSYNTYSGIAYTCTTKDTSSLTLEEDETYGIQLIENKDANGDNLVTHADKSTANIAAATLLRSLRTTQILSCTLNSELNMTKVDWALSEYWPWEVSDWASIDYGKSLTDLGMSLTINTTESDAMIQHALGDVMLDTSGTPVTSSDEETRKLVYHVNMVHCDYKPIESTQEDYTTYRTSIQELLRSYFNTLEATQPLMLERTELYYTPIKSMGYGTFKGVSGDTIEHPLEITVHLKLYVSSATASSDSTKELIENNVLTLVEAHIADGSINCAMLANDIRTEMSDTVLYVDVLGINDDPTVQTLITDDPSISSVRLKSELVLNTDSTISVEKGLELTWAIIN